MANKQPTRRRKKPRSIADRLDKVLRTHWKAERHQYEAECGRTHSPARGQLQFQATPTDTPALLTFTRSRNGTLTVACSDGLWNPKSYNLPDPARQRPGASSLRLPSWRHQAIHWGAVQVLSGHWQESWSLTRPPTHQELEQAALKFIQDEEGTTSRRMSAPAHGEDSPEMEFARRLAAEVLDQRIYQEAKAATSALRINVTRYNRAAWRHRQQEPSPGRS